MDKETLTQEQQESLDSLQAVANTALFKDIIWSVFDTLLDPDTYAMIEGKMFDRVGNAVDISLEIRKSQTEVNSNTVGTITALSSAGTKIFTAELGSQASISIGRSLMEVKNPLVKVLGLAIAAGGTWASAKIADYTGDDLRTALNSFAVDNIMGVGRPTNEGVLVDDGVIQKTNGKYPQLTFTTTSPDRTIDDIASELADMQIRGDFFALDIALEEIGAMTGDVVRTDSKTFVNMSAADQDAALEQEGVQLSSGTRTESETEDGSKYTLTSDDATVTDTQGNTTSYSDALQMISSRASATADFLEDTLTDTLDNYATALTNPDQMANTLAQISARLIQGEDIQDIVESIVADILVHGAAKAVMDNLLLETSAPYEYISTVFGPDLVNFDAVNDVITIYQDASRETISQQLTSEQALGIMQQEVLYNAILSFAVDGIISGDYEQAALNTSIQTVVREGVSSAGLTMSTLNLKGEAVTTLSPAGAGLAAAGIALATSLLSEGELSEQAVGQSIIAGSTAYAGTAMASALLGTAATPGFFGTFGALAGPAGIILGAVLSVVVTTLLSGSKVYHDETVSHKTEVQDDGTLLITGLREAGSLLRTGGTTDDDYYGNDSVDDTSGHDVIVGQSGKNEIYGRGGHDFIEGRAEADYIEAGTGDDHVEAGSGNDYVDGGAGNDRVMGGAGDDNVLGGDGADIVLGGAGDDNVEGNAGNDKLYGGIGDDTLLGGAGNDKLDGGNGADVLVGEEGDDLLDAGAGDDTLQGNAGNDTLFGGIGNDTLEGGDGQDILFGEAGVDQLYGGAGDDVLDGGKASDILFGGIGGDTLLGGFANDALYGEIGNDLLVGGRGNDALDGGIGNDVYVYSSGDGLDTITDSDGADAIQFTDLNVADISAIKKVDNDLVIELDTYNGLTVTNQFLAGNEVETLAFANGQKLVVADIVFDASGNGTYTAVAGDDVLSAYTMQSSSYQMMTIPFLASTALSTGWLTDNYDLSVTTEAYDTELYNDVQVRTWQKTAGFFGMRFSMGYYDYYEQFLRGNGQRDRIVGMYWDETITGANADDQLYGNVGADTIHGGLDADLIYGGAGVDTLSGEDGTDKIFGGTDNDIIYGGEGNDTLFGEWGNDTLSADNGEDYLSGGLGDDHLTGGAGRDILYGDEGHDILNGGTEDDFLDGNDGDDTLNGDSGNDLLFGGSGNDILNGGSGDDILLGGGGIDILDGGDGQDILILSGNLSQYSITFNADYTITIIDQRSGSPDGTITLTQTETIQFFDQELSLDTLFPKIPNLIIPQGGSLTSTLDLPAGYTASLLQAPSEGAFTLNADGTYSYAAPVGHIGEWDVTYQLVAPNGIVQNAVAHITVPSISTSQEVFTATSETTIATYVEDTWGSNSERERPRLASLTDGTYILAWVSMGGSHQSIQVQRFTADGAVIGSPIAVEVPNIRNNFMVDAASLTNGGFALTWTDWNADGNEMGTVFQCFDAQGNATTGQAFLENSSQTRDEHSRLVQLENGNIVIVWTAWDGTSNNVYQAMYNAAGTKFVSKTLVATGSSGWPSTLDIFRYSDVIALKNGSYVVSWTDIDADLDVHARMYNADGTAQGAAFLVSDGTTGRQENLELTALSEGGFVAVWTQPDESGTGVFGQRFDASGHKIGLQFNVATTTVNNQDRAVVTALSDGGFVVVWNALNLPTGEASAMYAQRFNNEGNMVGNETCISETNNGGNEWPAITELANGDVVFAWQYRNGAAKIMQKRWLASGTGAATLWGTDFADAFVGTDNADTLVGNGSDDLMVGGKGNDYLDGGDGQDAAGFLGSVSGYNVIVSEYSTTVSSSEGTDTLLNMESLVFSDTTVDISAYENMSRIDNLVVAQGQTATGYINLPAGLTAELVQGPTEGTMFLTADGHYSYTAPEGFLGEVDATYQLIDAHGIHYEFNLVISIPHQIALLGDNRTYTPESEATVSTYVQDTCGSNSERERPRLASLTDGTYILVWVSMGGSHQSIQVQRFTADGAVIGSPIAVGVPNIRNNFMVDAASLTNGGFALTWTDWNADGNEMGTVFQCFDAQGNATTGQAFLENSSVTRDEHSRLVQLENGNIVIVWTAWDGTSNNVYQAMYNAAGTKLVSKTLVATGSSGWPSTLDIFRYSDVIALKNGSYVVSWTDIDADLDVHARMYNADGTPQGTAFLVSDGTTGRQENLELTALSEGGFVAVWTQPDESGTGVFGQRFDASGNKIGLQFNVATTTVNNQDRAVVTALSDGGFVVVWNTLGVANVGTSAIYAQRFDSNANSIDNETLISTTNNGSTEWPTVTELANGDIVFAWQYRGSTTQIMQNRWVADVTNSITVTGTESHEHFVGLAGNDIVDGAGGVDTVQFTGNAADYSVFIDSENTITVTDNRLDSPDGTDTLKNVEVLAFADQSFDLSNVLATPPLYIQTAQGALYDGNLQLQPGDTVSLIEDDIYGSVVLNVDGTYQYTAPNDFVGDTSFVYQLTTAQGIVRQVKVHISVPTLSTTVEDFTALPETIISTYVEDTWAANPERERPRLISLSDGSYLLAWLNLGSNNQNIQLQRFSADGEMLGDAMTVEAANIRNNFMVDGVALTSGGFALTWTTWNNDSNSMGTVLQIFNSQGTATTSQLLLEDNALTQDELSHVAQLENGNIVTVWTSWDGSHVNVYQAMYNLAGDKLLPKTLLSTGNSGGLTTLDIFRYSDITALANGGYVVSWTNIDTDLDVYACVYNANGIPLGNAFLVSENTTGRQEHLQLTALTGGGFVATWSQPDSSGIGVFAQRFDNLGNKVGIQFNVATTTINNQNRPEVTALSDGGFVVVWNSLFVPNVGNSAIYAQRFDNEGNMVGDETLVSETNDGGNSWPAITELANGDIVFAWQYRNGSAKIMQKRWVSAGDASGGQVLLGEASHDILVGADGADILTGGAGNDTLQGSAGDDFLSGGIGDDTYILRTGDGHDIVDNQDSLGTDKVVLGTGFTRHNVWFEQENYDLKVSSITGEESLTLQNWYASDAQRVDSFNLDGYILDQSHVNQLVNAMASFNPETFGEINSIDDLPAEMRGLITASWKTAS